jgi:hypothetical protein
LEFYEEGHDKQDGFVYLSELQSFFEILHVDNSRNIATYLFDEAKSKGEFEKDKVFINNVG